MWSIALAFGTGRGRRRASSLLRDLRMGRRARPHHRHLCHLSPPHPGLLLLWRARSPSARIRTWLQELDARLSPVLTPASAASSGRGRPALRRCARPSTPADLGQRIERDGPAPITMRNWASIACCAGLRARAELQRFYDETLGALVRYDATHGTELVRTLEVFFEQNANASQTARALLRAPQHPQLSLAAHRRDHPAST